MHRRKDKAVERNFYMSVSLLYSNDYLIESLQIIVEIKIYSRYIKVVPIIFEIYCEKIR